jgi:mono/diheme cytochrome c family protein
MAYAQARRASQNDDAPHEAKMRGSAYQRAVRQLNSPKGAIGMNPEINKYRLHLTTALGILIVLPLLTGFGTRAATPGSMKPWVTPARARRVRNPVKVSPEGLASAAELFQENCAPCHGEKGAGDGELAEYIKKVKPSNFTDTKMMSEMTDGELFWKMSEGRPPMPPWKDQLTETQRWQLVSYLRTLPAKDVAQKEKGYGN